jgi:hypothetical protein
MRHAVGDGVHRPVPAVDRAVVQDEFPQPRYAAVVEDPLRILVVVDRQQGREVAQVLLEKVVGRVHPPLAEPGPGPYALGLELGRAGVGGLLEQRRPGLAPQLPAEQERGVGAHGDLYRRHRLRGVPHIREPAGRHLKVQLYGGAGGLGGYRLRGAGQALHAVDVQCEFLAPRRDDPIVQQPVPLGVREVRGDQVPLGERGKNSDHHEPRAGLGRLAVGISKTGAQLLGQLIENAPAEPVRNNIYFQIEHSQLGLEILARDALKHLRIHHPWQPVDPGEIKFDLEPHEILGPVEPLLLQQPRQPRQALPQLSPVPLPIRQVYTSCLDLLPHRSIPPRVGTTQRRPLASRTIMPRLTDP